MSDAVEVAIEMGKGACSGPGVFWQYSAGRDWKEVTMSSALPLHDRVSRLFEGFRHMGSPDDLDPVVAAHVSDRVGYIVSTAEVKAFRDHGSDSPDPAVLEAVATFFEAPVTYLLGTVAEQVNYNDQLDYFDNVRNSQATVFALRTRVPQLTPDIAERLSVLVRDTHERFEVQSRSESTGTGESK
ncbi:hypothetical protein [Rhodococcoides fascians]|uniref:hypothetical protein n=1 Tax=Rhodococcoides fascians TaxID=1828 RepID=UPI0012D32912|nr:hypothetical protein [Rhodococcus fascians]